MCDFVYKDEHKLMQYLSRHSSWAVYRSVEPYGDTKLELFFYGNKNILHWQELNLLLKIVMYFMVNYCSS